MRSACLDVLRAFRANPWSWFVSTTALALGFSAAAAAVAVADAELSRRLPWPEAESLVSVQAVDAKTGRRRPLFSSREYDSISSVSELATLADYDSAVSLFVPPNGSQRETLRSVKVSVGFLDLLKSPVRLGRQPQLSDCALTHTAWVAKFGAEESVVGRHLSGQRDSCTVVAVLGADFRYPVSDPLQPELLLITDRKGTSVDRFRVIARSHSPIKAALEKQGGTQRLALVPLREALTGRGVARAQSFVWIALAFMALCCCNAAVLAFLRTSGREQEFRIRHALGMTKSRLCKSLLIEAALTALVPALIGLVIAHVLLPFVNESLRQGLWSESAPRMDVRVAMVTGVLGLGTTVLATLAALVGPLRIWSRGQELTGKRFERRAGLRGLVTGNVAATVMVTVIAYSFTDTVQALSAIDLGFDPVGLHFISARPPKQQYKTVADVDAFYHSVRTSIRETTGVGTVAEVDLPALSDAPSPIEVRHGSKSLRVELRRVSDDYFAAMGLPIRGRTFSPDEMRGPARIAVVSSSVVRALDATSTMFKSEAIEIEDVGPVAVVGLTDDVRDVSLRASEVPTVYIPNGDSTYKFYDARTLVFRCPHCTSSTLDAAQSALDKINPAVVVRLESLESRLEAATAQVRFVSQVSTTTAAVSILLLWSMLALMMVDIAKKIRPELAVRMALGAPRTSLTRVIWSFTTVPLTVGAIAGFMLTSYSWRGLISAFPDLAPLSPGISSLALFVLALPGLAVIAWTSLTVTGSVSTKYLR